MVLYSPSSLLRPETRRHCQNFLKNIEETQAVMWSKRLKNQQISQTYVMSTYSMSITTYRPTYCFNVDIALCSGAHTQFSVQWDLWLSRCPWGLIVLLLTFLAKFDIVVAMLLCHTQTVFTLAKYQGLIVLYLAKLWSHAFQVDATVLTCTWW